MPPPQSRGFFSNFFGSSSAESEEAEGCGECNAPLVEHLKECDDLGKFPPLIEKCEDIPEYQDLGNTGKSSCKDCKRPDPIKPPVDEPDCGVPEIIVVSSAKCRPMPKTDCRDCKPDWLCSIPRTFVPKYKEPEDDQIVPISWGGRAVATQHRRDGKMKGPEAPTGLNGKCPAMKSKNCGGPGIADAISGNASGGGAKQGFFSKMFAKLFGKKE